MRVPISVLLVLAAGCSSSGNNRNDGSNPNGEDLGTSQSGPPETHDVVDPSLGGGIVGSFDNSTPSTGGLALVYPNDRVILPHDLAPLDVQWNAPAGANAYRVTFAVETGDRLRGFVPSADWIPPATEWSWLLDRAAGHQVTLTVDGGAADPAGNLNGPVTGSQPQTLHVSHDDATGALFYFATTGDQITGDGTLERLTLGSQSPDKYLNKSNDGGRCVGCHTLTRDGSRLAFSFLDLGGIGGLLSLGDVDATNPTTEQAPASQPVGNSVFNPDGTRLITSYQGKLTLRDGMGNSLAAITTAGPALYPDWSPDGAHLVFVRPSALCTVGALPFGQDSIFVYGGSLVTMDVSGDQFTNEQVVLQSAGENNYYPAYSPDGRYLAFSRADSTTKSSWVIANSACAGQDGSGLSYDNASATVWLLPTAGGAPTELTASNGAPMVTDSWPKWGPKADGEYLWLSFSSTRPYGNVLAGANAHHQIWITAIAPAGGQAGDPSSPAVWFPFQDTVTKNHIGMWSVKVGDYSIM